ncbi:UNVERIFIED_CONTAM: hypothetical protein NCL1_35300 [Trichonephila clavipes]
MIATATNSTCNMEMVEFFKNQINRLKLIGLLQQQQKWNMQSEGKGNFLETRKVTKQSICYKEAGARRAAVQSANIVHSVPLRLQIKMQISQSAGFVKEASVHFFLREGINIGFDDMIF